MPYPTKNDLKAYLEDAGLYDENQHPDLDKCINAAIKSWERRTGWQPFLVSDNDVEKSFFVHPNRPDEYVPRWAARRLFLHTGLISVTKIETEDRELEDNEWGYIPRDGVTLEPPFTDIWVNVSQGKLTITGKFGYCEDLPVDVWNIILQDGAMRAFPQIELAASKGLSAVQTLTSKVIFNSGGKSTFANLATGWKEDYVDAVLSYKMVGLGR